MDDCPTVWAKAHSYLSTQTQPYPRVALARVLRSPTAKAGIDAIDAAMRANDPQACTLACRAYARSILKALKEDPTP